MSIYNVFSFLDENDLEDIASLQSIVMKNLKQNDRAHFIIERSKEYFKNNIQFPHAVLGVRTKGKLVAQSIFHHSQTLNPEYIKGLSLDGYKLCDPVSILQGALIHPDHRGQKLLSCMTEAWFDWAQEHKYKYILTRIQERNDRSLSSFKKSGLQDAGSILDARDGVTVKVLYKRFDK